MKRSDSLKKKLTKAKIEVRNIFIKISHPLSYRSSDSLEYTIVYRVDNDEGESPHNVFAWINDEQMEEFMQQIDPSRMPDPLRDSFDQHEKLKLNTGDYGNYFFGFESLAQHDSWFTQNQVALYQQNNFKLRKYKATEVRKSDFQIIFIPFKGDLLSARV